MGTLNMNSEYFPMFILTACSLLGVVSAMDGQSIRSRQYPVMVTHPNSGAWNAWLDAKYPLSGCESQKVDSTNFYFIANVIHGRRMQCETISVAGRNACL
jgi:hypothetical protein